MFTSKSTRLFRTRAWYLVYGFSRGLHYWWVGSFVRYALYLCNCSYAFLIRIHGLGWFLIYSERVALMLFGFCSSGVVYVDGNGLVFCGVMFLASPKKSRRFVLKQLFQFHGLLWSVRKKKTSAAVRLRCRFIGLISSASSSKSKFQVHNCFFVRWYHDSFFRNSCTVQEKGRLLFF
jgi:hypothetical protein